MSTNKYQILIKRQQEEFNKFPIKFAFNDEQFKQGMKELGLDENDTVKGSTMLTATSYYIDELTFTEAECSEKIFLKDGERANPLYDTEVGDILTKIEVEYSDVSSENRTFWIISSKEEKLENLLYDYVSVGPLLDVSGTEYELEANSLIELGIINDCPDGTLRPDKEVTKAEMLKFLVCTYGLNDVAALYSGATPFDDVREDHWANGHMNIAFDFNFTNVALEERIRNASNTNLPQGFRPDDTITYAEAITYCLRALGYGDVVDSKGTWPTNYIEKAIIDLNLLDGISYRTYNDPVTRGNCVKLIWNMLKTKMWALQDVPDGEGNGLVIKIDVPMFNVKFPNYKIYMQEEFDYYEIKSKSQYEAEVMMSVGYEEYKYDKNDFYTFIPTMKVNALVNTQEEKLLVICPNEDKRIIKGAKAKFDGKYDALAGEKFDYIYGLVENRDVENNTMLTATSYYIDELKNYDDLRIVLKPNGLDKLTFTEADVSENIFLKDGERVNPLYDIEVGDILTKVEIEYSGIASKDSMFWLIGTEEHEGKLRKYAMKEYEEDGLEYHVITVGQESFCVDLNARYVEDTTKLPLETQAFYNSPTTDMKNEIVIVKLSPIFNKAVRIEFDGKLNAGYMERNRMKERIWTTTDYVIGSKKYLSKQVESITILNKIPTTGIEEKWDISYSGDGSVVAWVKESSILNDGTKLYDLHIASNGIIVPESCSYLFADYINCTSIEGLEYFETTNVEDMDCMFFKCGKLKKLAISELDTSSVTDMTFMFNSCESLTSVDVSEFDTSNVTSMRGMFASCSSLTQINVSEFNTQNVTDMSSMFAECSSLTKLNINNFDTSKVTNMDLMFVSCTGLKSLKVNSIDTSNVENMSFMFGNCCSLKELEISNFDTSSVIDMEGMFRLTESLTELDLSNFNTSNVTDMKMMFQYCENLVSLNLNSFDTKKVTSFDNMFSECNNMELILIGNGCTFLDQIPNNDIKIICTDIPTNTSDIIPLSSTELKDKLIFYVPNLDTKKIYEENSNYISVFGKDRIKPILSLVGSDTVNVIRWANYKEDGIKFADYTYKELDYKKFGNVEIVVI